MVVTIKEDSKTLECKETMNVYIEKLPVQNNHCGDQYMRLLKIHIFNKQNYFQQMF